MIKVSNLILEPNFNNDKLKQKIASVLKINASEILDFVILKSSIDARRKPKIFYVLTCGVTLLNEQNFSDKKFEYNITGVKYNKVDFCLSNSPVVVGFGPSGMFCALALSEMGLKPIVIEQGADVKTRDIQVKQFWETGKLNVNSNVQFGEGGAGTFSDGKLNTNVNNTYCLTVINQFYLSGAPKQILFEAKPHIGSDKLKTVVKNIRMQIIKNGGKVMFNTQLSDILVKNNRVCGIKAKNVLDNSEFEIKTENLVLAVGHSAKQVYYMLKNKNVTLEQKPFAMGVRIEQLQSDINFSQYGNKNLKLPSADYKLVTHLNNGRSVFTFCMCPGGQIVNSASEENTVVTNGMSNFLRDGNNANSAVLVNVTPSDFNSTDPLAGVEFQSKYERLAFECGGKNYNCPAQSVGEFLTGKKCELRVKPSLKVTYANLKNCLPSFVYDSLKLALPILNTKLKNFAHSGNLLVGIESRSSSPVTIVRDDNFESSIKGLFPCGEGAGYAGGITTSAVDGLKTAEHIRDLILKK